MGIIQVNSIKAPKGNEPKNFQSQENSSKEASSMPELDKLKMPMWAAARLHPYDTNKDGKFDTIELEGLPEAGSVFEYGTNVSGKNETPDQVSAEHSFEVLSKLSDSKISRILQKMIDTEVQSSLFKQLYQLSPERALNVIIATKDSPYQLQPLEGNYATQLIFALEAKDQKLLLSEIAKVEPKLLTSIKEWQDVTEEKRPPNRSLIQTVDKEPAPALSVRETSLDLAGIPEVFQKEYLITNATAQPTIQTFGAGPCVIVSLYDKETKTGLLAHFDATTPVYESMDRMLQEFSLRGIDVKTLEARLVGGASPNTSGKLVYELQDRLSEAKISVVEQDILNTNFSGPKSVQLHLEDGKLTDFQPSITTTSPVEFEKKANIVINNFAGLIRRHPDSLPSVGVSEAN